MSETTEALRHSQEHTLDMIEMANFNDGFEAAIDAIDELSNKLHNEGDTIGAEILRWAAKELRGENA
jgi:soluble cytochrome b562